MYFSVAGGGGGGGGGKGETKMKRKSWVCYMCREEKKEREKLIAEAS